MSITSIIADIGRPVSFYPSIARAFGDINTALIVCQFMYWRSKVGERDIYKTQSEIENETCVPAHTQRRIFKRLSSLGMVTIKKKGVPAKNYFTWDWSAVDNFLSANILQSQQVISTSGDNLLALDATDCNDKSQQFVSTITENTTETTQKITTESKNPKKQSAIEKIKSDYEILSLVDEQVLSDWLELRKQHKAVNSKTALTRIENTLNELFHIHRIDPTEALAIQIERGWRGLKSDWVINHLSANQPKSNIHTAQVTRTSHVDSGWFEELQESMANGEII